MEVTLAIFAVSMLGLGLLLGRYVFPASPDRKTRLALSKAAAAEALEENLAQALEKLAAADETVAALLRGLSSMAARLAQAKAIDEAAQAVGETAATLLGAKELVILAVDGAHLKPVWSRLTGMAEVKDVWRMPPHRVVEMLRTGSVLTKADLHEVDVHPLTPEIWAPIGTRGELWGVIHAGHVSPKVKDAARLAGLVGQFGGMSFKAMELTERLGSFNKQLEAMVHERTLELRRAYEELKELDRAKDEFISSVSHELRTPLTSIRSFSELLLTFDDEQKERRREFLTIINEESKRLTRLIDDVLDIAKIESGQTEWRLQDLDLAELARNVVELQRPAADERKITLRLVPPPDLPLVIADRDRIKQVLMNLLSNAVKFSYPGGEVVISLKAQASEVMVTVADQGVGIPDKDKHRVFMRFQQLGDATTGKPPGTGLGLAICKEIISRHGGRIWVEDNQPRGCRFSFVLPALAEQRRGEE